MSALTNNKCLKTRTRINIIVEMEYFTDQEIFELDREISNESSTNVILPEDIRCVLQNIFKDLIFRKVNVTVETSFSFHGYSHQRCMRENDEHMNINILFHSKDYAEFDVENCTFEWTRKGSMIKPRKDDIICGILDDNTNHQGKLKYKYWFIASDQFLKMWTMVMYDDHRSFKSKTFLGHTCDDNAQKFENMLYNKLFSENTLCTAPFKRITLKQDITAKDVTYEPTSIRWMHVYAAIVLICCYHEIPCSHPRTNNIPITIDRDGNQVPQSYEWDIPSDFIENLMNIC